MVTKKKILLITPLPPPVHGSSMVSENIRKSTLVKDSFDMDFVNLSTSRTMEEIGKKSKLLYLKKLFRFLGAYFITMLKLLRNRYDLCYLAITCYGVGFLKDMPFVLLCKLFKKKVVIHHHNKGMSLYANCAPYKWLMPWVYKNTKVILLSDRLYDDIKQVVKREQILICPNGIPQHKPAEKQHIGNSGKTKLLFLSNLLIAKGVYVLLDACKILKDRQVLFSCDIVGGESKEIDKALLNSAIKDRGLENHVFYHGPKYGEEKDKYWNSADIFVFPTYNETFGLVLLEAMQNEIPCVSTNEGGIPDIIENGVTGFICEKRNSLDLCDKIQQLVEDKDLSLRMGNLGAQRYANYFTLEKFEERLVECLKECI